MGRLSWARKLTATLTTVALTVAGTAASRIDAVAAETDKPPGIQQQEGSASPENYESKPEITTAIEAGVAAEATAHDDSEAVDDASTHDSSEAAESAEGVTPSTTPPPELAFNQPSAPEGTELTGAAMPEPIASRAEGVPVTVDTATAPTGEA